jgi:hypothetical protein
MCNQPRGMLGGSGRSGDTGLDQSLRVDIPNIVHYRASHVQVPALSVLSAWGSITRQASIVNNDSPASNHFEIARVLSLV